MFKLKPPQTFLNPTPPSHGGLKSFLERPRMPFDETQEPLLRTRMHLSRDQASLLLSICPANSSKDLNNKREFHTHKAPRTFVPF